ncbi:MAG: CCA tRNA nucleotidyltransferase [Ruminococcus sp.]|nr:CCA tRNA nucleotidyltransferase [Ruminococcus sp.]
MSVNLSQNALFIISNLTRHGYDCYAVGGCVRDSLRGIEPKDWDFTTSALPDEIEACFADCKTVAVGKKYGTIAVILDGEQYEITTFRVDGEYKDSRHPETVLFSKELKDDLSRRDFTVNAMAYSPDSGLVDLFGGERDLEYGVIRCVGDPEKRFGEDALRILRALRFASVFNFTIEPQTQNAILKLRNTLSDIAAERIVAEMNKLLCGENVASVLRRFKFVFAVFIPELSSTFGFEQNSPHHNRTVFRHLVASVKNIEPDPILRTAMLFHDIAKPLSQTTDERGKSHYKNHPMLGAAMAEKIMKRMCYPNHFIEEVTTLIRHHDDRIKSDPVIVKKYLGLLGEDMMKKLLKVMRADVYAQSMYKREEKLSNLDAVEVETERILTSGECYQLKMLAVSGRDIIHLGVASGKQIGEILNTLLNMVIKGEIDNSREELLTEAKKMI